MDTRQTWEDINLVMTCGACPEQYDAYLNGEKVGYLRLRHGLFAVWNADQSERLWHTSDIKGDGIFADDEERDPILKKARKKIWRYLQQSN